MRVGVEAAQLGGGILGTGQPVVSLEPRAGEWGWQRPAGAWWPWHVYYFEDFKHKSDAI